MPVTGVAGTTGTSMCNLGAVAGVPGRPAAPPSFGANIAQAVPPPAVSGGTLRVLADGVTAVAADPDRDQVYVVDLGSRSLRATVTLNAGDEPGRVIQDAAGRVHVALRRGGAIVSIDPVAGELLARRSVCAAPRGLAYDATGDLVHVACADGELISLPAAGGPAARTVRLDRDLRDVVVADGGRLRVSRFRSAELVTVEADGTVSGRLTPPAFSAPNARGGQMFTASIAWRTLALPDGGVMMLHQRGVVDAIMPSPGGYGSIDPCTSIVHPTVTTVAADGSVRAGAAVAGLVLAVDAAVSADGSHIAFVSMGNSTNTQALNAAATAPARVFVTDTAAINDAAIGCRPDGVSGPCVGRGVMTTPPPPTSAGGSGGGGGAGGVGGRGAPLITMPCSTNTNPVPQVVGEPIAVAFAGDGTLVVQSREPAMLAFAVGSNIMLSDISRADTGHKVFHANAGGGIACASCHAEGDDDGRVWNFACSGARRTQSLQTGLRGTEPFHWSGDEATLDVLMKDVFVGRMSGPMLTTDQTNLMLSWIDGQPRRPRAAPADPAAVARGQALFNDTARVGCVSCHSGDRFSNNQAMDVGTGAIFQVPSLLGIGTRGPYMHNGCAPTLSERFTPSCGGNKHGAVDHLSPAQLADLIAYVDSI
jgi:mono/diheme cytochrome c family protein